MGLHPTTQACSPCRPCACCPRRALQRRSASSTTETASSSRWTSCHLSARPCLRCIAASTCSVTPARPRRPRRRPCRHRGHRGCPQAQVWLLSRRCLRRCHTRRRRRRHLCIRPARSGCRGCGSPYHLQSNAVSPLPGSPSSQSRHAHARCPPRRAHPPLRGRAWRRHLQRRAVARWRSSASSQPTPPTCNGATPTARSARSTSPCSTTCLPSANVGWLHLPVAAHPSRPSALST